MVVSIFQLNLAGWVYALPTTDRLWCRCTGNAASRLRYSAVFISLLTHASTKDIYT